MQISCDICTRFARYLYSTKQSWIIRLASDKRRFELRLNDDIMHLSYPVHYSLLS